MYDRHLIVDAALERIRPLPSSETVARVTDELRALTLYCESYLRPAASRAVLAEIRRQAAALRRCGISNNGTRYHFDELLKRAAFLCATRRWRALGADHHEEAVRRALTGLEMAFRLEFDSIAKRRARAQSALNGE